MVKALANRQAQAPERNVVRHIKRTDSAKEDGVECFSIPQGRSQGCSNRFFQVIVRIPIEVFELQIETGFFDSASSTSTPAAMTSTPMPSPGTAAIFVRAHFHLRSCFWLLQPAIPDWPGGVVSQLYGAQKKKQSRLKITTYITLSYESES
ncbi:hypothetical protein ACFS4T_19755 [Pseudomonas lini]